MSKSDKFIKHENATAFREWHADHGQSVVRMGFYGTLRNGSWNHRLLQELVKQNHAFLIEEANTTALNVCVMLDIGGLPGLYWSSHSLDDLVPVVMDLYWVSPEGVARLDALEGHPVFYTRTGINLDPPYEHVYVYLGPRVSAARETQFPVILSGDWLQWCTSDKSDFVSCYVDQELAFTDYDEDDEDHEYEEWERRNS